MVRSGGEFLHKTKFKIFFEATQEAVNDQSHDDDPIVLSISRGHNFSKFRSLPSTGDENKQKCCRVELTLSWFDHKLGLHNKKSEVKNFQN